MPVATTFLFLSLALAQDKVIEVTGSSGKHFPDQAAACEAAQADALAIAQNTCNREDGRFEEGSPGDCTCEQGGFEDQEWLCSAPATLDCTVTETVAVSTRTIELEVRPPETDDPLQIASYAFKRRGESLPPAFLKDRFANACNAGWGLGCQASKWVTGGRYNLDKVAPMAAQACKSGDHSSCVIEGWGLESTAQRTGDGKHYREAAKIYKRLCTSQKLARGCYEYGTILFNNLGVTTDPKLGIRRWEEACKLGEPTACTVLAKVYRLGLRTTADPEKALEFATKACEATDPAGCLEKAHMEEDAEAILDARVNYCTRGGAAECWEMASSYLSGDEVEPQAGMARGLLAAGCDLAHAPSCTQAADLAKKAGDDSDAASIFRKSCDLGEVSGCNGLTQMILNDRAEGSVKDEQYPFEVACSKGEMLAACSALGLALLEEDRAADRPRARALLRQSCIDESSPAKPCFVLGDLYETGAGGERDRTLAARYYKWSCAQGWGEACERRGDLLDGGVGVREDDREAVVMYQSACDSGSAEGCHKAGVLLDEGTNINRDPKRAQQLFETGCERKVGLSCLRLGRLKLEGAADKRDESGAREAFEAAVALDTTEAYRKLSWVLWNGVGGKKSKKRSKELAAAGCQRDDPIACRGPAFQTEKN